MELKEKLEQQYREQLEEVYEVREQLNQELAEIENKRNEIIAESNKRSARQKERLQKLYDDLSDEGKKVLQSREGFWLIAQSRKKYAFLISAIYAIVVAGIFYFLNLGFATTAIIAYAIATILIIPIYIISLKCLKKPWEDKWWATYSDPSVIDYDKKIEEERKITSDNCNNIEELRNELYTQEREIYAKLREANKIEKNILLEIDELDFNIAYCHTILFWGTERWNYYDIYIDGYHYDTVRGKTIVPITLDKGLHSFKVTNTCRNFDNSIISSYTFNAEQIEVTDIVESYPVVVDMNTIKYPTGKEFQEITKQKLI